MVRYWIICPQVNTVVDIDVDCITMKSVGTGITLWGNYGYFY